MENARSAKDDGRIGDYKYFDDLAWEVRAMNSEITDLLYAEGFLQEHGII